MNNLDKHLNNYLASGNEKNASDSSINDDLISKLAAELEDEGDEVKGQQEAAKDIQTAQGNAAVKAQGGETTPDGAVKSEQGVSAKENSNVSEGTSPGAEAAMKSKTDEQVMSSGGNVAEQEAGSTPTMPIENVDENVATKGEGQAIDKATMNKSQETVAKEQAEAMQKAEEAAKNMDEKTASEVDAMGARLAMAMNNQAAKQEKEKQAAEATALLKEAGLLDNYEVNVDLEKTAGDEDNYEGVLEKIANGELENITEDAMIAAAEEFQKMAEEVEAIEKQAEEDAVADYQQYEEEASAVEKQAEEDAVADYESAVLEKQAEEEAKAEEAEKKEKEEEKEEEKKEEKKNKRKKKSKDKDDDEVTEEDIEDLKKDPEFVNLLKKHGLA